MWNDIPDIVKALAAIVPATLAAMRFLRPQRLIGLLSAAVEREMYRQMADHEKRSGEWWRAQAIDCQTQLLQKDAQCRD